MKTNVKSQEVKINQKFEFMLRQCCESSLTCSTPPPLKLHGEERGEKGGPEKKRNGPERTAK